MLWFLLRHARCNDSLLWKMLIVMEGFAVYAGLKPDKARSLVMALTDESPFLRQVPVGRVVGAVSDERLRPRSTWLSRLLRLRLLKMQDGFDEHGDKTAQEASHG